MSDETVEVASEEDKPSCIACKGLALFGILAGCVLLYIGLDLLFNGGITNILSPVKSEIIDE